MNLTGLSVRDLQYAVAVADLGSFVKAAEHCRVAQPSLSVQVNKLEQRLKTLIFERTTRRVIVTPEGRLLIEQMRRVLVEAGALLALAHSSDAPFGGKLRLSAIATLGPYLFPRVLPELRRAYPSLPLVLGEGRTHELVAALAQGDLDAVMMSPPLLDASLTSAPLFREPFLLACPGGQPAAAPDGDAWSALETNERLLLEEGHCLRDQALAACAEVDPASRHATSLETLKYMVAAGEGCTLMPLLAATETPGVVYSTLPGALYGRLLVLAWRRSDPRADQFAGLAGVLRSLDHPGLQVTA
jgi:LysR family hydrogen peroxide-inducible transcriptional activator